MPKFFVKNEQIKNNNIKVVGEDVKHIKNVLRAKIGEKIEICDISTSTDYICNICEIQKEYINCKIEKKLVESKEPNIKVTIFQGIPKWDKMELIIQKSVELGVYEIYPVEMKRCVVKLKEKDANNKILRWQKISEVAAKQCGRNIIPKIQNIIDIKNICNLLDNYDILIVAYENEKNVTLKEELKKLEGIKKELKIGIVIGPEGGLEEEDVKMLKNKGAKIVTLGKRILRTETVALNMLSIIMYELES